VDKQNQRRIGNQRRKHSLRLFTGKAIDLFVSAMAILLTGGALIRFLKHRHRAGNSPREMTKRDLAADEQNQQRRGHQTSDLNVRPVIWTAIGLAISAIAIYVAVGGLFSLFKRQYASASAPSRITTPRRLPPPPRLQTNPTSDLQRLLEAENAKLNSYGWVDQSAGVVRIPIDRAMDLLAQRGLPTRGIDQETGDKTSLQMRQEKAEASHP
jgi:hypothetical protein